ncbi:MAG TPA: hypothetical protein VKE93_21085 [Candidatus Angelobacter sp.]|nr:hypothetical protein [Candidatus Angelobacter sp.]
MTPNLAIPELNDIRLDVARRRLRESVDQADALEGIREIVSNLLGSEEMGVFPVQHGKDVLPLLWSFGIDPRKHQTLDASYDGVVRSVIQGAPHIALLNRNTPFSVLVPIRLKGQTVAILAILRLLPQKTGVDESDMKLLELLSDEAGQVLFACNSKLNAFRGSE